MIIVCSSDDIEDKALSGKSLGDEVKRLEDLVDQIQRDIDLIKYMPPYTWRIYVKDKKKKSEKLSQLERDLKSFKDAIRMQEEAIEVLMRDET